ncbi:carboxy terminal-processing peptidase [Ferruginibacter lapsinanis]|uniref:carboxy terminal-processing peptidase n=1 Tax=Ferruginibacter lapsinanis TaxID=563172 RepID=UPI001E2E9511|nr:carboxy terminal-processing peptidase [Ferruginibacter lapsinanis]UEG49060.1 carboxy terminal-processing peptidase [Ferruginibacter lapsinanis]
MKNKFLVILFVLAGAGLFLAFQPHSINTDNPKAKNERILRNVGLLLEQGHYSPKEIDDNFSKEVLKVFLKTLDDDKSIFLQSDIDGFKNYETVIDDEIHATKKIESFYAISDVYTKRLKEVSELLDGLLAKPFDFNVDESVVLDGDKLEYPKTEAERKEVWRKRLKYIALTKYVDMLDAKEKNKGKATVNAKPLLPEIAVNDINDKTTISWTNNYKTIISYIIIQQSPDSNKNFRSIASIKNPNEAENAYVVPVAYRGTGSLYRAIVVFQQGKYFVTNSFKAETQDDETTMERKAREQTKKQIGRYFTTLKNHNTNDELFSEFVNAITNTMDPHTDYFAPIDQRFFAESMSGTFFGIGAQLKEEESKIKISSLVTGGPAWKSGDLQPGDEIIKIGEGKKEPVDVTGYSVSDAVKLIRGEKKGTEVRLTLRKVDGSIKVISLLRDEIKTDDTFAKSAIINGEKKIGYIYLPVFYMDFDNPAGARCSQDVAKEIEKLKAENVEGIIMDLRGNGGGSLPEVVKMAGLFIEEGPICQVKGRDEKPYVWRDRDKAVQYSGPLTVLVDENSASASEIFAAAIQDYKRGIIVGSSSTYGKGTVQRSIPLNPEGGDDKKVEDLGTVKMTMQKFYRINGGATQLRGVTPDVIIPDRYEFSKSREKDNPSALGWDEIAKSDYVPLSNTYSEEVVVQNATTNVTTNTNFKQLEQNLELIEKYNDKQYSLNLNKFREEQNRLKALYKSLDSLTKLPKELDVKNTQADLSKVTADKEKIEKNKFFIDRIKSDMYIEEALKVMNTMISQTNLAAQKN